jgi:flagellar motor switch protein FliN
VPLDGGRGYEGDALEPLLDIKCHVDFVLGTGKMSLRDCLRLERHAVIRLDQSAGCDLGVSVHGILVATGEVVIIDDTTALRVSHVTPPAGVEAV